MKLVRWFARVLAMVALLVAIFGPLLNLAIVALERVPPRRLPLVLWSDEADRQFDSPRSALRFHPVWMWELAPGAVVEGDPILPNGTRGEDVAVERTAKRRFVVLGDSQAFGNGVPDKDTWPRRMVNEWREGGAGVELLNFACAGHTILQDVPRYEQAIAKYRPDVVLVEFGTLNESSIAPHGFTDRERLLMVQDPWFRIRRTLLNITLLRTLEDAFFSQRATATPPDRLGLSRVSLPELGSAVKALAKAIRDSGAQPVFVVPLRRSDAYRADGLLLKYDAAMRAAAAEVKALVIDLPAILDAGMNQASVAEGSPVLKAFFQDPFHPTAIGHTWIAKTIRERLQRFGLAPKSG